MADIRKVAACYADPSIFDANFQQSQQNGRPQERAKSVNELYIEHYIGLFSPFAMDRSDVSFAARLMSHWANLDEREPTVKIVCRNYAEKPQPGLHNWDSPNLLWELLRTRRVKLSAQQLLSRNAAEAILDKDNHARDACLVAGTMITTGRGGVPIEQVVVGDYVLTRSGWNRVTRSWMTSSDEDIWRAKLNNGHQLLGTGSHPVWTAENNFSSIDTLKYGMTCLCERTNTVSPSTQHGWASNSEDIPTVHLLASGTIGAPTSDYTPSFGFLNIVSRFLRSITSTIRTEIVSTTRHSILKLFWQRSILPITVLVTNEGSSARMRSKKPGKLLRRGIHRRKAGRGILKTAADNFVRLLIRLVRSAASRLRIRIQERGTPFVLAFAGVSGDDLIAWTLRPKNANCAARNSGALGSIKPDSVQEYAQVVSAERIQLRLPVYNVEVEGQHEYFANGILVHNCKYVLMSHPEPAEKSLKQRAAEAVKPLAEAGDLTSALIRYQQIMEEEQVSYRPARLGRQPWL
jgi:hypothetical protein